MKHFSLFLVYSVLMIVMLIQPVVAQDFGFNEEVVDESTLFSWSAELENSTISAGRNGTINVTLSVADEHIVYRKMTDISVESPDWLTVGAVIYPEAKIKVDPIDNEEKPVYEGNVSFSVPFTLSPDAPLGSNDFTINARYQGCSKTLCFFPQTVPLVVSLTITEAIDSNQTPTQPASNNTQSITQPTPLDDNDDYFAKGYLLTFLMIFGFGLLTALTPCVYPLIPITVTIFGARETKNTFHAFSLALTYVLGIAMMYTSLGYVVAVSGSVFGQFMSNPWVMSGIALFFVAMALSMFGLFELQLPSSMQAKLTNVSGKGFASAFLMGLVSGIIAAPCTGPILAGILAYVATEANPQLGMLMLFIFAMGLGLPFLIIGTFSGMISRLPKSGGWMEHVKSLFGIILLICALYFLKNAFAFLLITLERSVSAYGFLVLIFVVGLASGAVHLSYHIPKDRIQKTLGLILCVLAGYAIVGSVPPIHEGVVSWIESLDEGLAQAQQENKPIMIDFYADWCTACKELDHYTYSDERVGERLKDFISIKVDLSKSTPENTAIQKEYSIKGLPVVSFIDTKGERLTNKRITGFVDADDFLKHIHDIE